MKEAPRLFPAPQIETTIKNPVTGLIEKLFQSATIREVEVMTYLEAYGDRKEVH